MDPTRTNDALVRCIAAVASTPEGLGAALRQVMEEAAAALDVERASAWLYSADGTAIRCVELFVRSAGTHEHGVELFEADYPKYFAALREARTIAARDAHTDLSTAEFSVGYLRPLGIGAMLDCPIRIGAAMVGVLCNEHVGGAREWTELEARFARSIADLLGISIEASRRREIEQQLRATLELVDRQEAEKPHDGPPSAAE